MTARIFNCDQCDAETQARWQDQRFCSPKCAQLAARKFEVSAAELEELVWTMPTVAIARRFGVSDKAIAKRCKTLYIAKPPRGYWAQMRAIEAALEEQ